MASLGTLRVKLGSIVLCLSVTFGLTPVVRAELLAYEGFDYAVGAGLLGLSGGSGWAGGWDDTQAAIGSDTILSGSMSYTDSLGNVLMTTGNSLRNTGIDGSSQGGRTLSARRDSGSTWISFVVQRDGPDDGDPTGGLYPRGANLALFDINNTSGVNIEKLNIGPNNTGLFWIDPDTQANEDRFQFRYPSMDAGLLEANLPNLATNRPTPNTVSMNVRDVFTEVQRQDVNFVVIRIDHIGDEQTGDDILIWMNPRLDETPSDTAVSAAYIDADMQAAAVTQGLASPYQPGNFGDQAFDRIRLFAGGTTALPYSDVLVDEIRVGTTFQAVAPFVSSGEPGDYNADGVVNAADYVIWRNGGPLENDPTPGVQPEDYDFWVANFGNGQPAGSGSSAAVPEPAAAVLVCLAAMVAACRRRYH